VSRKQELLKKRNQKIYLRYKELYDVKFLRHEKVLEQLSEEFYLLPDAIGKIVVAAKKEPVTKPEIIQTH
jgi:hypothetical protein